MNIYISKIKKNLYSILYTQNSKNGVSLIMSLMVLSLILTTAVAISTIFTGEIKNSRIFEQSMYAYYAADSGAEALLYRQLKSASALNNGQNYTCDGTMGISFSNNLIKCQLEVDDTTLRSTGTYNEIEAQRKVEITL